jgi:nucleoside-diphosphate-sugar epimerase
MIVSITGGNGFIGQHLVLKHILLGDEVRLLTRHVSTPVSGVNYYHGDLLDSDCNLSSFVDGADLLYHCAGEINNQLLMYNLHVDGTKRLIDSANGRIGRWVQLSSVGVYGPCRNGVITEGSQENPCGTYEQTKSESDHLVINSGLPYVILRPSNVFGALMRNQSLLQLIKMLRRGLFFYIGKPGVLVNYIHVDDVVEALILCGRENLALGQIYNLSQTTEIEHMIDALSYGLNIGNNPIRLPEMFVRMLVAAFGWIPGFPLTLSRVDALTGHCRYSSSKIMSNLGFEFGDSLEDRFRQFTSTINS